MSDVAKLLRNDAVARFDAIDLAEKLASCLDGQRIVLDGTEWEVREGVDVVDDLVISDEQSGQSFLVTIHLDIARHP